jgi:hypothetical protein
MKAYHHNLNLFYLLFAKRIKKFLSEDKEPFVRPFFLTCNTDKTEAKNDAMALFQALKSPGFLVLYQGFQDHSLPHIVFETLLPRM